MKSFRKTVCLFVMQLGGRQSFKPILMFVRYPLQDNFSCCTGIADKDQSWEITMMDIPLQSTEISILPVFINYYDTPLNISIGHLTLFDSFFEHILHCLSSNR